MSSIFCLPRVTLHSQLSPLNVVSFSLNFKSKPSSIRVPNVTFPKLKVFCMREIEAPAVTKESWERLVLKSETPILVEFYASWCGPCRMVHRVIDEIATNYVGRLKFYVLNTDDDFPVAEEYEIKAVPVVLLFKNGEKRESIVGTMPKEHYVAAIEGLLKS